MRRATPGAATGLGSGGAVMRGTNLSVLGDMEPQKEARLLACNT